MINLSTIFASTQKGFLKNFLKGAGLALGVSGVTLLSLQQAISYFEEKSYGVPAALLGLLGLSGFDVFFALILGAIVAKHKAKVGNLVLRKK
jgi:hypothetical protein